MLLKRLIIFKKKGYIFIINRIPLRGNAYEKETKLG